MPSEGYYCPIHGAFFAGLLTCPMCDIERAITQDGLSDGDSA